MKKIAIISAIAIAFLLVTLTPVLNTPTTGAPAFVQAEDAYGLDVAAKKAGFDIDNNNQPSLPQTIGTILFIFIGMIGVIFLVLVIYGGFLWMTAGGNTEKTKKAAAIMRNGAIGVLIILSAYAITYFVLVEVLATMAMPGGTT